jgi:nitrogen regulatory protein PII-like uncharacterized protein
MRKPVNISVPYRAVSPEDEAFNDIERMSKIKQEILRNPSKEAQLIAEVTVLTELVKVLSKKLAETLTTPKTIWGNKLEEKK